MIRFKVVGRREEPGTTQVPSTVPGMPPQFEQTTSASLLVIPVDEEGKIVQAPGPMGGLGPNGGTAPLVVSANSLEDLAEYVTGQVYELVPSA